MIVRVVPGGSLSEVELARWSEIRQGAPSLASPFFSPIFTSIVAACRDDVRVGILEEDGEPTGFFPFQRGRFGLGCPVGSLLSDCHGVITPEHVSWDARALIRACGLNTWNFDHLVASQAPFEPFHRSTEWSKQIDLSNGFDAYIQAVQHDHGPTLARLRGKTRKLEREHGTLCFTPHTDDPTALAMLLRWKSDQYTRTGASDVAGRPWVREVLRRVHAAQADDFAGQLSLLTAAGRPIAAHLGVRSASLCHSWFPAYDPAFAQYSPGLILLLKLAEAAHEVDIALIDLGKGDYRYKLMLTNRGFALAEGSVESPSLATALARSRRTGKALIRRTNIAPRLRRLGRGLMPGR